MASLAPLCLLYVCVLLFLGLIHKKRITDYKDFIVAGAVQPYSLLTLSLLASMLGGSATIGAMDNAGRLGFAAFWWLGAGAIGLWLQSMFLTARVRNLNAYTLPDVVGHVVGKQAAALCGLLIVTSWVGVIAAQFTALHQVLFALLSPGIAGNSPDYVWLGTPLLIILASVIILYTCLGGQLSVIRTDFIQVIILFASVLLALGFLLWTEPGNPALLFSSITLFSPLFLPLDFVYLLFIVGATFFIGPDIFSRALCAKDASHAKKAARYAAVGLFFFSLAIACLGILGSVSGSGPVFARIIHNLPLFFALLLGLGLFSALLSSADTCLMSAASILENDIWPLFFPNHTPNIKRTRGFILLLGALGVFVATQMPNIIGLLLAAYSIYAPGIVAPLAVAILVYPKHTLNKKRWMVAVATGGLLGFLAAFTPAPYTQLLPLAGMAVSFVMSLNAVQRKS